MNASVSASGFHSAAARGDFLPPPPPGLWRGLLLALVAHMCLVGALTWGVQWQRNETPVAAEAELWSQIPVQAAPRAVPPVTPPEVTAAPLPVAKPLAQPQADAQRDADIALQNQKDEEKARAERDRKLALDKATAQKAAEEKNARDAAAKDKAIKDKLARDKAAAEQAQTDRSEQQRQENLKRIAGLAGASGAPTGTGAAPQSAGPSAAYGGRIKARVKPNIVFTQDIGANPTAEVEVRCAPDGTIIGQRIVKASGNRAWDEAVLSAVIKTEVLPRDESGRVPSVLILQFRPRD